MHREITPLVLAREAELKQALDLDEQAMLERLMAKLQARAEALEG